METASSGLQKNKKPLFLFGVSSEEKNFFIENLSLLLDSDMGISYTLETLASEVKSDHMRYAIGQMRDALKRGDPFWKALDTPKIFPPRLISLVKTGEDGGTLSESLKSANLELEKDNKFRSQLRSALIYPGVVFFVAITVMLVASATVLPKLTVMFQDSKTTLPLPTRMLMAFGHVMETRGFYLVPLIIASFGLIFFILFIWKRTKYLGDFLLLHTPIFRTIIIETEVARMGYTAGSLLRAGIPVTTAFESLAEGAAMASYRDFYIHVKDRIRQGDTIQKSLTSYPQSGRLLPFQVIQIIGSAEKSGKLSDTLSRIGSLYEAKSDTFTKNIGTIIEPAIIIVVGLIVGIVVVAIIGPIYSLTSAIS